MPKKRRIVVEFSGSEIDAQHVKQLIERELDDYSQSDKYRVFLEESWEEGDSCVNCHAGLHANGCPHKED